MLATGSDGDWDRLSLGGAGVLAWRSVSGAAQGESGSSVVLE